MKVLVTGVSGQLGYDVAKELKKRGHEVKGTDSRQMDITDGQSVRRTMLRERPEILIHCAAYTAVDKAEDDREGCRRVNVEGTENLAQMCGEMNVKMLYISTEYVFSGQGETPWKTEDATAPLNWYGQTKYEGEQIVQNLLNKFFIVRISWLYGIHGSNFVKTMLRIGKEKGVVSVVNDQIGSPTYTKDLAVVLSDMAEGENYGIYHVSGEGECSWYEFAREIFLQAGMEEVNVIPVPTEAFPTKAKRPANSRMSKEKLKENGFTPLPAWQDALRRYIAELAQEEKKNR